MKRSPYLKSIVVLVVICLLTSAALAVVNHITAPVIAEAKVQRENASRKSVLPEADAFEPLPLDGLPASVFSAYRGTAGGTTVGYVFTAGNKGFESVVEVMCAIAPDGKLVKVATLDVSGETKTLGGQLADAAYTDQYTGKDSALEGVDGVSGATFTSEAYTASVKDCFAAFDNLKEG